MGFRLQNFAPLGPEEFAWGWIHILRGFNRRIFRHPSGRFLDRYAAQGLPVEAVPGQDNRRVCCYICGYAMAALVGDDGWRIEACSATNLKAMLGNARFQSWRQELPPTPADATQANRSTHLQTSGH